MVASRNKSMKKMSQAVFDLFISLFLLSFVKMKGVHVFV